MLVPFVAAWQVGSNYSQDEEDSSPDLTASLSDGWRFFDPMDYFGAEILLPRTRILFYSHARRLRFFDLFF